jgi:hypothetical protein
MISFIVANVEGLQSHDVKLESAILRHVFQATLEFSNLI